MNVVPKSPTPQSAPNNQSQPTQDARSKAIAAFNASQAQRNPQPVPDANNVSPEELGALGVSGEKDKEVEELTPEATVESEAPKAPEKPLSSQHAILARKEKQLRAQIQQFQADKQKFEQERLSLSSQPKQELDLSKYVDRERLKQDPYGVLTEAGLTYDEITQAALNAQNVQTDPRVTAQIAKLEKMVMEANERAAKLEEASQQSKTESYQQAVAQIKSEASKLVYTDPAFELIKETNSVSDVVELIESTFKADGILMTVEEACQAVEEHLVEEAMKLSKIKKLQQKLGQSTAPTPVTKPQQPQPNAPKTLTNGMATPRPMSVRERAIAAMEGKLNK